LTSLKREDAMGDKELPPVDAQTEPTDTQTLRDWAAQLTRQVFRTSEQQEEESARRGGYLQPFDALDWP
jgi:hypothetical protein